MALCVVCVKEVRPRQHAILCDRCDQWQHRRYRVVLPTGSKRGKPLLVDNCGYSYTIQKSLSYAVYWWCSVRPKEDRCRATVSQRGEQFTRAIADHNHTSTSGLLTKATIDMKVREVAKEGDYFKSSGVMAQEIYQTESDPSRPCPALAPLHQAARRINKLRQGDRPKEPKDLEFEIATRHLPENFLRRDIRTDGGQRHLVFATDHQLKTLSSAKTWYIDSTFRVVSPPFYQLLSIHAFLVSGSAMKQVPLLNTLMSRRQKEDYVAVFSAVRDLLDDNAVEKMVTDFGLSRSRDVPFI